MRAWTIRQWLVAAVVAILAGVVIGTVTALLPNPLFTRMIEAPWWSYPVWVVSAMMTGLLVATYVAPVGEQRSALVRGHGGGAPDAPQRDGASRGGTVGAVLSFLAVGCPTCNKLVVLALGTSGAVTWFEPVQPILAVGSMILLGYALRRRLRFARSCPVPATAGSS